MEQTNRAAIDRLDLRLLDILQRQGALSVAEVAAKTKLSTTTCWRRIQQLEQNGVIKGRDEDSDLSGGKYRRSVSFTAHLQAEGK